MSWNYAKAYKTLQQNIQNATGPQKSQMLKQARQARSGLMSNAATRIKQQGEQMFTLQDAMNERFQAVREQNERLRKRAAASMDTETPPLDYFQGQDIDSTEDSIRDQADRIVDSADATFSYPTGAEDVTGLGSLMSFVTGGESYGGSLDAANRGTVGKKVVGSTKTAVRNGKKLSEMTLAEIKELQAISDPNDENRLFAVGKFQMVPDTLLEAQKATGVSDDAVFNAETQEKLGKYLFTGKANTRKTIAWLNDEEGVTIEDAIMGLAKEFASVPVPYDVKKGNRTIKAGNTYYSNTGNKAKYTIAQVTSMLKGVKDSMGGNM